MRRICSRCCARAASGQENAAPPRAPRKSLRLMPASNQGIVAASFERRKRRPNVRFGSKADMCSAKRHVRFSANSGHLVGTGKCLSLTAIFEEPCAYCPRDRLLLLGVRNSTKRGLVGLVGIFLKGPLLLRLNFLFFGRPRRRRLMLRMSVWRLHY